MKLPTSKLGYAAAGATVLLAVLVPFLLTGTFTNMFSGLGLHVDEMYSGGPKVRTLSSSTYSIDVHRVVSPHMLQRETRFVQLDFKPVSALPAHTSDTVDIDGDGHPDVRVTFDVPQNPKAPLRADIDSLNPVYQSVHNVGARKFSSLIVHVDDAILVRVPLADH
jgi:hypothetical protein